MRSARPNKTRLDPNDSALVWSGIIMKGEIQTTTAERIAQLPADAGHIPSPAMQGFKILRRYIIIDPAVLQKHGVSAPGVWIVMPVGRGKQLGAKASLDVGMDVSTDQRQDDCQFNRHDLIFKIHSNRG